MTKTKVAPFYLGHGVVTRINIAYRPIEKRKHYV